MRIILPVSLLLLFSEVSAFAAGDPGSQGEATNIVRRVKEASAAFVGRCESLVARGETITYYFRVQENLKNRGLIEKASRDVGIGVYCAVREKPVGMIGRTFIVFVAPKATPGFRGRLPGFNLDPDAAFVPYTDAAAAILKNILEESGNSRQEDGKPEAS